MSDLKFKSMLDWLVAVKSPLDIYDEHASFLLIEIVLYVLALLTLSHAMRLGGRYTWLWVTTVLHGITVESFSYFLPDNINNFWHAQSMLTFLGRREPLHIFLFYPAFIYVACVAADRLHLKKWAEPFAVGLGIVLLDVPWDIMGIKLLWWTWHDTDPNIFDRHYWVPWTSYFFHASFACSFCILFHGFRQLICKPGGKYQTDSFHKELVASLLTGLLSMPLGIIQFIILYHPLHDDLGLHTEVCVLMLMGVYVCIIWMSDRNPAPEGRTQGKGWCDELLIHVLLHFPLYIILAIIEKPQNIRAIGLHEQVGNCNETAPVYTAFGQVLKKKAFLCPTDYDEGYYDWHCLPGGKPPADGSKWYTMCGTGYENKIEYIIVVSAFSLLGLFVFIQMLVYSGKDTGVRTFSKQKKKA